MMGSSFSLVSTFSGRAFSTLSIFPHSGNTAWNWRSRPCLALPPAESPSTMYSSHLDGSVSEQSASLPGRPVLSSSPLRRVISRARRAALRALAASMHFSRMARAAGGHSCRKRASSSLTNDSTRPRTSLLPSFCLVWPSNWGSGTLTDTTAVRPSRTSSPVSASSSFLASFMRRIASFRVRVSAPRKPLRWLPPSRVLTLLAKLKTWSA